MNWFLDVGFFALLFFVLVFIHELGHYLMAKWVGIRVERFSIGMGPSLASFRYGETEYRIGLLPLGGYVKMSGDDPSKEYSEEEKKRGFLTQKPPAKLLVVFGGPVFNLLLPIFIFGSMLAVGVPHVAPTIGTLQEAMPASRAGFVTGDKVLEVNGRPIVKWSEVEKTVQESANQELVFKIERLNPKALQFEALDVKVTPELSDGKNRFGQDVKIGRVGVGPEYIIPQIYFEGTESIVAQAGLQKFDRVLQINDVPLRTHNQFVDALESQTGDVRLLVSRGGEQKQITLTIPAGKKSVSERIGLVSPLLVLGHVEKDNPAARAGIQVDDRIVSLNGKKLTRWDEVSQLIKSSEGKAIDVEWSRDGKMLKASIVPERTTVDDPVMGKDNPLARDAAFRIGVSPKALIDTEFYIERSSNPLAWIKRGVTQTWDTTTMTMEAMFKLMTGELSIKLLGSPIMIYKVAGNSYRMAGGGTHGWISFFSTLALLSISLGIVNLFPIPVLDGGHATFFLIEWIRGRPVSLKVMEVAMQVGVFVLLLLFALVIFNDFQRYGWIDSIVKLFS